MPTSRTGSSIKHVGLDLDGGTEAVELLLVTIGDKARGRRIQDYRLPEQPCWWRPKYGQRSGWAAAPAGRRGDFILG
jgi:hypothetical protein